MFTEKHSSTDKYLQYILEENPNLILIKHHRILLRFDHKSLHDEVKVLSCGPSSRAPLHTGMVGPGMLTGAVVGDTHNTPTCRSVLTAFRETGRDHPPAAAVGVLLIAMNSPAERTVSMMACQQAATEGLRARCVVVGEDTSGVDASETNGRRGHCGVLFLQKIAGAMAQDRKTLEEIYTTLNNVKHRSLGTVCWWLRGHEMVVGHGLRGDHGRGVVLDIHSLTQVVAESLAFMFSPSYKYGLDVSKEDRIAVIINNTGSLSEFHFRIVVGETKRQIREMGLDLARCYTGGFLSTESPGVSLSVLKLDKDILKWLDSTTSVKPWPCSIPETRNNNLSVKERIFHVPNEMGFFDKNNIGPMFSSKQAELAVNIICNVILNLEREDVLLDELDEDHDYGTSLKNFFLAVKTVMAAKTLNIVTPYGLLNNLADLAAATTGGMAGAVLCLLLSGASQGFMPHLSHEAVSWSMWMEAVAAARTALCAYTGARQGDGTVLDTLHPFVEAFDTPTVECLERAVMLAGRGAAQSPGDPAAMSLYAALRVALETLNGS